MFTKKPERGFDKPESDRLIEPRPHQPTPSQQPTARTPAQRSTKVTPSIIGEDLSVIGNMVSKGEVHVDGEIQGDIHCHNLLVGEKATVNGGVVAEDVMVRGRVTGSIRAQRVTLQSTCHVEGDIHHQMLAIEQGAFFEGKSRRSDNPTAVAKPETAAKPAAAPVQQQQPSAYQTPQAQTQAAVKTTAYSTPQAQPQPGSTPTRAAE